MELPESCVACGLHKYASTYCMPATLLQGTEGEPVDILFVADAPKWEDDREGYGAAGPAGQFLRDTISPFNGVNIALTHLVKCRPPERVGKKQQPTHAPEKPEIKACSGFLQQDLQRLKPKVVVALGGTVLEALWPGGPKSITQAKTSPVKIGGHWLVTQYDPGMHIRDAADLRDEYLTSWKMVAKLLQGTYAEENPDIREVTRENLSEALAHVATAEKLFLDAEWNTVSSDDHPELQTIYMPGRKMLCCGISCDNSEPVWVFPPQYIPNVMSYFMTRTLVLHNCPSDVSVFAWLYTTCREWIWKVSIEDTFFWHASLDLGYFGNSLDALVLKYCGVPSWKAETWDLVKKEDARRAEVRKEIRKEIREYTKEPELYADTVSALEEELKRIELPATLEDIPWQDLVRYQGKDAFYPKKLYNEAVKRWARPPVYENLYLKLIQLLGPVSTYGLLADRQRAEAITLAAKAKVESLSLSLRAAPEVRQIELETLQWAGGGYKCPSCQNDKKKKKGCLGCNGRGKLLDEDKARAYVGRAYLPPHDPKHIPWSEYAFNTNSGHQLNRLLELTGVEVSDLTPTGLMKTDKKTLKQVAKKNALWRRVTTIASHRNLLSKFLEPLQYHIAVDGRVHCEYAIARSDATYSFGGDVSGHGTATGRLSAQAPALHNIKKDDLLRSIFVAPPGWRMVEFDYGAMEVRILAWIANVQVLLDTFAQDRDPYIATAEAVWGTATYEELFAAVESAKAKKTHEWNELERVATEQRKIAKVIYLAVMYRMGVQLFAATAQVDEAVAKTTIENFYAACPEIKLYHMDCLNKAERGIMLETPWGRKRSFALRSTHDENACVNFLIQSSASDVTCWAAIQSLRHQDRSRFRIVNLVHDSIWAEVKDDKHFDSVVRTQMEVMTNIPNLPFELPVKMAVDCNVGHNLGDMKKYKGV